MRDMKNDQNYIQYLERLVPDAVDINKDYMPTFQKEALFIGGGWYEWGAFMSKNPRELLLKGTLARLNIKFKDE